MANRPSRIVIPMETRSSDGKYWGSYPHGDRPSTGAVLEAEALAAASGSAALKTAIKLAGGATDVSAAAGGLSTRIRLDGKASNVATAAGTLAGPVQIWAPNFASVSAGMSTLMDRQWDPTDPTIPGGVLPPSNLTGRDSTGMEWFQSSNVKPLIATPASLSAVIGQTVPPLPDGHATCMAIKYPAGFGGGNTPFGIFKNSAPSVKRMYMSCWVFMPEDFDTDGNNIKWVFFAQNGSHGRNHVFMLNSGDKGDYIGPWLALQGGGGSGNVGGVANTRDGAITLLEPPASNRDGCWDYRQGAWVNLEWFAKMETTPGVSGDGLFWCCFNGTKINDFRNINYSAASGDPSVFDTLSFTPYYGGGGGAAPSDQYLLVGRFFCAGGN